MKIHLFPVSIRSFFVAGLVASGFTISAKAAFDWNQTIASPSTASWSLNTNWNGSAPIGGPDSAAAVVTINNAPGVVTIVDLFDSGDAGDAIKTVGSLTLGNKSGSQVAAGTGSGILDFNNGVSNATLIQSAGSNAITAPVTLTSSLDVTNQAAAGNSNRLFITGVVSGSGAMSVSGPGYVYISGIANTFSGGVTLASNGFMVLGGGSGTAIGTGKLTINGGTLSPGSSANTVLTSNNDQDWNANFAFSLGVFSMTFGSGNITLNNGTCTINVAASNTTRTVVENGVISDGGHGYGLIKNGNAVLNLKGNNTFTGGLTVNTGTVSTSTTGTFGAGNVTVATGAFLTEGNNASFGDLATLTFSSTSTASSISLNFTGTDTLGAVYDSISSTYLASGTYTASQLNSYFSSSVFAGTGSLMVAAIPESSTFAAIFGALALGSVVIARRRRA